MEEPAWFVFFNHSEGVEKGSLTEMVSGKYGLPKNEALRFTNEIIAATEKFTKPFSPTADQKSHTYSFPPHAGKKFVTRCYTMNGKYITISYGSRLLEYYIHRSLAHLVEVNPPSMAVSGIELFEHEDKYVLRNTSGNYGWHVFSDVGFLKHRLFIELSNFIYNKSESDWMSFVHASAVTDGHEALLITSSSGAGKSTLTALLQRGELFFFSDDFVPVDAGRCRAHLFPAALSVKHGAFDVVSKVYDKPDYADADYRGSNDSQVRFLRPKMPGGNFISLPVKKILFLRFNPQVDLYVKKLQVSEALERFHGEAWVSHNPKHAKTFIDWFINLDFFYVEYGNTERALDWVNGLFKV